MPTEVEQQASREVTLLDTILVMHGDCQPSSWERRRPYQALLLTHMSLHFLCSAVMGKEPQVGGFG